MKDREFFQPNENNYQKSDEFKSFQNELFSSIEVKSTKENVTFKEENVTTLVKPKVTKKSFLERFKEKIVQSSTHVSGVVSGTVAVASSIVVVSTLLLAPPTVENVRLECGNDYLNYSLDISILEEDQDYQIEVSNPSFIYKELINIEEANTLGFISGSVDGLKPNRQYNFKLLKDNGEIAGFSNFYNATFYTLKAPSPTALFQFDLGDDKLEYNIKISDVYDVCEGYYLVYKQDDTISNEIPLQKNTTLNISTLSLNPISFNVYASKYHESDTVTNNDYLLNSYTYYFTNISSSVSSNNIDITGTIGEQFKNLKEISLDLIFLDINDSPINTIKRTFENTQNINQTFTLDGMPYAYYYSIYYRNGEIYQSEHLKIDTNPPITFGQVEFLDDSLKVYAPQIKEEDNGTIQDITLNNLDIVCKDGYILIPLYDQNNQRYRYSSYNVFINGFNYEIELDTNLLHFNDFEIYQVNGEFYLLNHGYTDLKSMSYRLQIIFSDSGTLKDRLIIDSNTVVSKIDSFNSSYQIEVYLIDDKDNKISDVVSFTNIDIEDSISIECEASNNIMNWTIESSNTYDYQCSSYDNSKSLLRNDNLELLALDSVLNASTVLNSDSYFVTYQIKIGQVVLYTSDFIELVNLSLENQSYNGADDNLIVYAQGLKENMTGYILDKDGEKHSIVIFDDRFEIPIVREYEEIIYSSYQVYITNGIEEETYTFEPEIIFEVSNVSLVDAFGYNCISFDANTCHLKDNYSIVTDAYNGVTIIQTETTLVYDHSFTYDVLNNINDIDDKSSDTLIVIYLVDENNIKVSSEQEYVIKASDKVRVSYNLDIVNPGDVLVTYNDDGTINMYIQTNFSCDDDTIFVRVKYGNYYIDTRDKYIGLTDLEDISYPLEYFIIRESESALMVLERAAPSGSVNESIGFYPIVNKTVTGDTIYATIDISSYDNEAFDLSKTSIKDHPEATFDPETSQFTIVLSSDETNLTINFFGNSVNFDEALEKMKNIDNSFNPKGSLGRTMEYEITIY